MPQLIAHGFRYQYMLEEGRQYRDLSDQDQVIQRAGVGDNKPHRRSESSTPKIIPVLLEVFNRIGNVDFMRLEKGIERLTCREAK